jgi:RNA-directed DNA polymerase
MTLPSADLARALCSGHWRFHLMCRRVAVAQGSMLIDPRVESLVRDILDRFPNPPEETELVGYLDRRGNRRPRADSRRVPSRVAAAELGLRFTDVAALADLLAVDQGELDWLADVHGWSRRAPTPLLHYRWLAIPKRRGSEAHGLRVIAAPKPRLKEAQRRLLRHVMSAIPLHDAAHGSVPTRSVRSALLPHAGAPVLVRMDIEAFYPSITAPRVVGLLATTGIEAGLAGLLAGLCTTVVPLQFWRTLPVPADWERHRRLGELLRTPHLPTGAPTSPALANAVTYRMDRRLTALAGSFGARYTRYVDDLIFSGGRHLASHGRFIAAVEAVVVEEGFAIARRKTSVRPSHTRQALLGAVINDRPALPRPERDRLRAIIHNCLVHGPQSQGVDRAELLGRIAAATALDPAFGARLRASAGPIVWT